MAEKKVPNLFFDPEIIDFFTTKKILTAEKKKKHRKHQRGSSSSQIHQTCGALHWLHCAAITLQSVPLAQVPGDNLGLQQFPPIHHNTHTFSQKTEQQLSALLRNMSPCSH